MSWDGCFGCHRCAGNQSLALLFAKLAKRAIAIVMTTNFAPRLRLQPVQSGDERTGKQWVVRCLLNQQLVHGQGRKLQVRCRPVQVRRSSGPTRRDELQVGR